MCERPEQYPWSSHAAVVGRMQAPRWLDIERLLSFYGETRPVWSQPEPPTWSSVTSWAARLYESPRFDETERNYKLGVAQNVATGKAVAFDRYAKEFLVPLR